MKISKKIVSVLLAAVIVTTTCFTNIGSALTGVNTITSEASSTGITTSSRTTYFTKSVKGSTGWTGIKNMTLYKSKSTSSSKVQSNIARGTVFRITDTSTPGWWGVTLSNGKKGYVRNYECMINLPDVLPDIDYKITNASSAIYKSSGYSIDKVTGVKLYSAGKVSNSKLGYSEYLVPVMWETAKKISAAYHNVKMLGSNYTLRIYDAYRPYSVTTKIYNGLTSLYNSKSTVKTNIDYSYGASGTRYTWGKSWFLASGISTHNTGSAIDVTIVKKSGSSWKELSMPTSMHELSVKAIKYYKGFSSGSSDQNTKNFAKTMNDNAKLLDAICQGYSYTYGGKTYKFVDTGLDALSSEWWHFQDNSSHAYLKTQVSGNDFQVTKCMSAK